MWFNGGEVLHVIAEVGAQVLDEAVEQRREVQRVPRRPLVVVRVRVGGRSVVKRHRCAAPVRRSPRRAQPRGGPPGAPAPSGPAVPVIQLAQSSCPSGTADRLSCQLAILPAHGQRGPAAPGQRPGAALT